MRGGTLLLRDLDALVIAMGPYHTSVNHNAGITFAIFKGLTMPHNLEFPELVWKEANQSWPLK